jgi:hypothetical protein
MNWASASGKIIFRALSAATGVVVSVTPLSHPR